MLVRNDEVKDDFIIIKEEQGLLGLTGREDDKNPSVNKQSVVSYVSKLPDGICA